MFAASDYIYSALPWNAHSLLSSSLLSIYTVLSWNAHSLPLSSLLLSISFQSFLEMHTPLLTMYPVLLKAHSLPLYFYQYLSSSSFKCTHLASILISMPTQFFLQVHISCLLSPLYQYFNTYDFQPCHQKTR